MANILVIKHGAFGDFVQALGAMRAIRLHHRNDKITLLTTKPFVELAGKSGYFNSVVVDPRPRWYDFPRIYMLKRFFNAGKFARVYDLQNSERTGLYMALFKKNPEWNGIAFGASHRIADDAARKKMHVFEALKAQLAIAGIVNIKHDDLLWATDDHFPQLPRPFVLIAAGSSPQHPKKRWPVERYVALCQFLAEKGVTPVLLGTKDEADVNAKIAGECPKAINLTGKTSLFDIAGMSRWAKAAVGNDTGPIQMTGPTGCKTIALYPGFSNPARHGPLGAHVTTIQREAMGDISLDEVKAALLPLLELPAALLEAPAA